MRHEDIPEVNNPKIRFPVLEGDKLMKEVLNGGYNVHPVDTLSCIFPVGKGFLDNHLKLKLLIVLVKHLEEEIVCNQRSLALPRNQKSSKIEKEK